MVSYHCDGCNKGLSETEVAISNGAHEQITGMKFPIDIFCQDCLDSAQSWWVEGLPSKMEELRESNNRQIRNFRKAYFKNLKVVSSESQTVTGSG
jgi:hypothetical protein